MIEAIVAALVAALMREAPDALVRLLRAAGVLPDDMSDRDVSERIQRASDILGDVNPMHLARPHRDAIAPPARIAARPVETIEWPPEYEKPESD